MRYNSALTFSIPWIVRHIKLSDAYIIEIGCGSGSSTAALAPFCRYVVAYDIDTTSIEAAKARCKILGIENVDFKVAKPEKFISSVISESVKPDAIILYAVIEHLTFKERIEYIGSLWRWLSEGSSLIIIETPNRFVYLDKHTSELPFFHLLPDYIAFKYLDRCPREAFVTSMKAVIRDNPENASEHRIRWGLGASFHEFELALDDNLNELIVADGFEPEMLAFFPIDTDERLLIEFFNTYISDKPIGFSRPVLNFIIRKPHDLEERNYSNLFNTRRREEIKIKFFDEIHQRNETIRVQAQLLEQRWTIFNKAVKLKKRVLNSLRKITGRPLSKNTNVQDNKKD